MPEENKPEEKKVSFVEIDGSINGLKRYVVDKPDLIKKDFDNVLLYIGHLQNQVKELTPKPSDQSKPSNKKVSKKAVKKSLKR